MGEYARYAQGSRGGGFYSGDRARLQCDAAGEKLNVNADTAAGYVAAATKAEKLVLVSDTHGIREKKDDPGSLLRSITKSKIQELIAAKEIGEGNAVTERWNRASSRLDAGVEEGAHH